MTKKEIERLKVVLDRYKNSRCGTEDLNEIYDGCVSALKALESSRTAHAVETAALERAAEIAERSIFATSPLADHSLHRTAVDWLEVFREVPHD